MSYGAKQMSNYIFGYITDEGQFLDASPKTLRGMKISASLCGFNRVGWRNKNHYYVGELAEKKDGEWVNTQYCEEMVAKGLLKK